MKFIFRKIEAIAQIIVPYPFKMVLWKTFWKILYFKLRLRNFLRGERALKQVFCPISEKYFDEFVSRFRKYDPNIPTHAQPKISPDSGAREGLRLQWLFLKSETDLFKKDVSLLHFGPEYSFYEKFRKMDNVDYYPVDKNYKKFSKNVRYADLSGLDFQENVFDMMICNHVLEHVEDDKQAMKEMYRVLKPGGTVIITVPIDHERNETYEDESIISPEDREREFGQWDHLRYYGLDFPQKLESVGFVVSTEYYARTFSSSDFEKYGLVDEPIFVCKKP